MEASARVIAVAGGRARVACEDRLTCSACGSAGRCALKWFASSRGSPSLDVADLAVDDTRLVPGDAVILEIADGEILRAAATVYLTPLAGLLGGALLGNSAAERGDALAVALGLLGAAAGWLVARAWARRNPPRLRVRHAAGNGL
jgi:sigma-E factor negative regulatory protein RseC